MGLEHQILEMERGREEEKLERVFETLPKDIALSAHRLYLLHTRTGQTAKFVTFSSCL
jgi:hypothetical protein